MTAAKPPNPPSVYPPTAVNHDAARYMQPPTPTTTSQASPPSRRDLKSWWKNFKLTSKHEETQHGKDLAPTLCPPASFLLSSLHFLLYLPARLPAHCMLCFHRNNDSVSSSTYSAGALAFALDVVRKEADHWHPSTHRSNKVRRFCDTLTEAVSSPFHPTGARRSQH